MRRNGLPPSTPPDSGKALESARAALTDATARFAFSATPRLDAELLLAALDQWPQASGVGLDASPAALAIARDNAARIAPGRATIAAGGWDGTGEAFDLILCNPPYIAADAALSPEVAEYEPASALFAGPEGLDDYRAIAPVLGRQIAPGGVACIEIGYDQGESAATLFRAAGLAVALRRDLAGRDRCLVVTP